MHFLEDGHYFVVSTLQVTCAAAGYKMGGVAALLSQAAQRTHLRGPVSSLIRSHHIQLRMCLHNRRIDYFVL